MLTHRARYERLADSGRLRSTVCRGKDDLWTSGSLAKQKIVFVVDDDELIRESIRHLLSCRSLSIKVFANALDFLDCANIASGDCLITDVRMPRINGIELLRELALRGAVLPTIVLTGYGDVPLAVEAMKAGALDFLQKPFNEHSLRACVASALEHAGRKREGHAQTKAAQALIRRLTDREREVFDLLGGGEANKTIARLLGISPRTVEAHRSRIQEKLQASCLADLVRIARAADGQFSRAA